MHRLVRAAIIFSLVSSAQGQPAAAQTTAVGHGHITVGEESYDFEVTSCTDGLPTGYLLNGREPNRGMTDQPSINVKLLLDDKSAGTLPAYQCVSFSTGLHIWATCYFRQGEDGWQRCTDGFYGCTEGVPVDGAIFSFEDSTVTAAGMLPRRAALPRDRDPASEGVLEPFTLTATCNAKRE